MSQWQIASEMLRTDDSGLAPQVLIRSSDLVDFAFSKNMLSLASPFFESMFTLPVPTFSASPVIPVSESSDIVGKLFSFCNEKNTDFSAVENLDEACRLLDVADKYDMTGMRDRIGDAIVRAGWAKIEPLRVYAIACRYGLEKVARVSAKESLQLGIANVMDPDRSIDWPNLLRLREYHFKCSRAAMRTARDLGWLRARKGCPWFDCPDCPTKGIATVTAGELTYHSEKFGTFIVRDMKTYRPMVWWKEYMDEVVAALILRPCLSEVTDDARVRRTLEKTLHCPHCRQADTPFMQFRDEFAAAVDHSISEIALEFRS